ncbi:hypothetical protein EDB81DRAFT_94363 [Dactylonectria macrodidyma]|uniref:Uncharacterized protein n=1 Tax=Dactylonectria macrodidyma TaxID=307937 RepID=A0A9P9EB88_9HYPO|nr:hypothetical protein EDB81DRAFT_94363 [Dactylonectria macrodidyma]
MALRYPADFLLHLQDSPLCIKPPNLPPAEEWMGQPAEQARTQTKTTGERPRSNDNSVLEQGARRPGLHPTRNSANPEDIVFAPPRMAFASARGNKSIDDKTAKESDASGRFGNFRSRNGDAENDRFREGRPANGFRRRDGEGESEGWSTVKPRKSFGHEGAERFHGRMGGNFRDDRRQPRERDGEAPRDRPARNFDNFTRDKEGDDTEGRTRNGLNRTKVEPWFKNEPTTNESLAPEKRERIDRAKSWRDRDKDAEPVDDRNSGRNHDRRWGGREHRAEREPEWLDEPLEEHPEAHTQQDFQKWMEEMKKAKNRAPSAPGKSGPTDSVEVPVEAEKPAQSAPAVEAGPDKFFMAFGGSKSGLDASTPGEPAEAANKPKAAGKSSRFTSFFSHAQEEARGRTDASSPMTGPPMAGPPMAGPLAGPPMPGIPMSAPPMSAPPLSGQPLSGPPMAGPPMNGLPFLMGGGPAAPPAPEEERQAFQQLLMKLQKQTMSATPPGPSPFAAPPHGTPPDGRKQNPMGSPDQPFQQYGGDRRMEGPPMGRPPPQHVQEILAPRPQPQARPEQLLQDLVGQRQRAPSQPSGRPEVVRNNSNTEFLMNLMRAPAQDAQRNELLMRMAQPQKQPQMPLMNDREPDYSRDQRQMRPQPPPGFPMEDSFRNPDVDVRSNQPTQILQRPPPPPGLDQMPPNWMSGGGQLPPPVQQRGPMMGPPGLAGGLGGLNGPNGPNRNMPMPPHMFPPNFPPGGMPPLEAMGGMPPRNMPPPPPGFFGGPPHGFIPPGLGGYNGPPPEFAGAPFEARGMPPSGNPGRGAAYGRQ